MVQDIAQVAVGAKQTAPLFSSRPQAGFPSPGDDQIEKMLDINDLVVEHPASTFYVRVSGDSMEDAGIFDNDVLVVDRAVEPKHGSIVVAAVFGELVVKYLEKHNGKVQLMSAKEGYTPINLNDSEDCYLWGTVVGSVRIFT